MWSFLLNFIKLTKSKSEFMCIIPVLILRTQIEWGKTKHLTAIHICVLILFDLTTKSCKIHLHGKRDPVMQVIIPIPNAYCSEKFPVLKLLIYPLEA